MGVIRRELAYKICGVTAIVAVVAIPRSALYRSRKVRVKGK